MKIEVIKPKEEVKWNFPCKGISEKSNIIVGFLGYGQGVVLDTGQSSIHKLYTTYCNWNMDVFTPIKEQEKGNNYDWSNPKFPILAKQVGEEVFTIDSFDEVDNSVCVTTFNLDHNYISEERERFNSKEDRNEWLKSLEILSKGTEIKITF